MTSVSIRLALWAPFALIWAVTASAADPPGNDPCGLAGDPLLGVMQGWIAETQPDVAPAYCVFGSGAALAVAYDVARGLHLPVSQRLLWPGNLLKLADSTVLPERPASMEEASRIILNHLGAERVCLLLAGEPLVVYGVDSSFGEPWFFIARCADGQADSLIWDPADLKHNWWRWIDAPGANTIWPRPERAAPPMGRRVVLGGMRNLVLAARPDTVAGKPIGLAALRTASENLGVVPGDPKTLSLLTELRQRASEFLNEQADLWAPAAREPVKLAAYYLQKDAEAWRTLAAVAESWSTYDSAQRQEWLSAVIDWETRAAVAMDALVTDPE